MYGISTSSRSLRVKCAYRWTDRLRLAAPRYSWQKNNYRVIGRSQFCSGEYIQPIFLLKSMISARISAKLTLLYLSSQLAFIGSPCYKIINIVGLNHCCKVKSFAIWRLTVKVTRELQTAGNLHKQLNWKMVRIDRTVALWCSDYKQELLPQNLAPDENLNGILFS